MLEKFFTHTEWDQRPADGKLARAIVEKYRHVIGGRTTFARKMGTDVTRETVRGWERDQVSPFALNAIASSFKLGPEDRQLLQFARLPALDGAWLERQPEFFRAGMALRALRQTVARDLEIPLVERQFISRAELAERLGLNKEIINEWETGGANIDGRQLPAIRKALALSEEQYGHLMTARFPALRRDWFAAQEAEVRPGLLLAALHDFFGGGTKLPLHERVGVIKNTLSEWKRGLHGISDNYAADLAAVFEEENAKREPAEQAYGKKLIEDFKQARALLAPAPKASPMLTEAQQINKDIAELKPLDPEWLKKIQEDKRGGLVLRTLRIRAGIQLDDFEEQLGVGVGTASTWERGANRISAARLPVIRKLLKLNAADYRLLVGQSFPMLDKAWLEAKDPAERPTILLQALQRWFDPNPHALEDALGASRSQITHWHGGEVYIPDHKRKAYMEFYEKLNIPREPEDQAIGATLIGHLRDAFALTNGVTPPRSFRAKQRPSTGGDGDREWNR